VNVFTFVTQAFITLNAPPF